MSEEKLDKKQMENKNNCYGYKIKVVLEEQ